MPQKNGPSTRFAAPSPRSGPAGRPAVSGGSSSRKPACYRARESAGDGKADGIGAVACIRRREPCCADRQRTAPDRPRCSTTPPKPAARMIPATARACPSPISHAATSQASASAVALFDKMNAQRGRWPPSGQRVRGTVDADAERGRPFRRQRKQPAPEPAPRSSTRSPVALALRPFQFMTDGA